MPMRLHYTSTTTSARCHTSPPHLTLPAQDRPVGGLGIMLVRHIMTHVAYSRAHGSNHLSMTISIPHP